MELGPDYVPEASVKELSQVNTAHRPQYFPFTHKELGLTQNVKVTLLNKACHFSALMHWTLR